MIQRIKVNNFRQFKSLILDTNSKIITLVGDNTKGKSTILEALHIIKNGNSPWNDFTDITNEQDTSFRIEIDEESVIKSIFRSEQGKVLKIDNSTTNSSRFFKNQFCILFSPELIEILMISPSKRREFIDNILTHFNIQYKNTLSKYNKVLRHRNAYIKKLSKELYSTGKVPIRTKELDLWTNQLIDLGVFIRDTRYQFFQDISSNALDIKYITTFEDSIDFITQLDQSYNRDVALGYTNVGVHRDDWEIITQRNIKRHGSRGEKRLAIIDMLFNINTYIISNYEIYPLLLLDDVPSELDKNNTEIILGKLTNLNQQIFLTTIKTEYIPKKLLDESLIIDLNQVMQV